MTNGDNILSMYRNLDSMLNDKATPVVLRTDLSNALHSISNVLLELLLAPGVSLKFDK